MQTQRQYTDKNVLTYDQGMNRSAAAANNRAPKQVSFSFCVSKRSQGNAYQQRAMWFSQWNRPQQQRQKQGFFNQGNDQDTTDFNDTGAL